MYSISRQTLFAHAWIAPAMRGVQQPVMPAPMQPQAQPTPMVVGVFTW